MVLVAYLPVSLVDEEVKGEEEEAGEKAEEDY